MEASSYAEAMWFCGTIAGVQRLCMELANNMLQPSAMLEPCRVNATRVACVLHIPTCSIGSMNAMSGGISMSCRVLDL